MSARITTMLRSHNYYQVVGMNGRAMCMDVVRIHLSRDPKVRQFVNEKGSDAASFIRQVYADAVAAYPEDKNVRSWNRDGTLGLDSQFQQEINPDQYPMIYMRQVRPS